MSDESSSNSDSEDALDLSGLNFGPAWARDPSESKSLKKFKDRGDREERRGGGGRRDDRRGGGRGDRRGGGSQGRKQGGRGRREDDRRPPRREIEPPDEVTVQLMPAEESLDLLAKRVIDSGQTYSVFDLAKVLLQSRERFRVTFETSGKAFFRCKEDQSIWLSRDEALRHLWRADWRGKFYDEVKVESEAPKGSFNSVARCGISDEILGPPNYHGYQEKLAALHRERFANMPFQTYKAKVRMEHGEEAVEAWLESMKTVTRWKIAEPAEEDAEAAAGEAPPEGKEDSGEPSESAENTSPAEGATPDEEKADSPTDEPAPEAEAEAEASAEAGEAPAEPEEAGEEAPAEDTPDDKESPVDTAEAEASSEPGPEELLEDPRAVERHFAEHHFDEVFEETNRAWVMGDIRGNLLSPGLLTLLKRTVAEEKRYPAKLMPVVCRQLSGRQVAVFKWRKKLKVGPSRPHAVPTDSPLAERPRSMIDHLTSNSGVTLKDFWKAVMPAGVTDQQKHDWFQDFQWLLGQGHLILLSDTTVHLAKKPGAGETQAKKAPEKKAEQSEAKAKPEDPKATAKPAVSEDQTEEAPPASETRPSEEEQAPETSDPEEDQGAREKG